MKFEFSFYLKDEEIVKHEVNSINELISKISKLSGKEEIFFKEKIKPNIGLENIDITIKPDIKFKINKIHTCKICLETSQEDTEPTNWIKMDCCHEYLKKDCFKSLMESQINSCPHCMTSLNKDNKLPYGSMTIRKSNNQITFKGSKVNTILITYNLEKGKDYRGEQRCGIIPDTKLGNKVVDKLINAFKNGYTFTIGKSITTGIYGIVWGGIHHKTTYSKSPYGYPDDTYLFRVENELAAFNIFDKYKGKLKEGNHKVFDYR